MKIICTYLNWKLDFVCLCNFHVHMPMSILVIGYVLLDFPNKFSIYEIGYYAKIRVRLMYITGFYEISLCPAANNNNNV